MIINEQTLDLTFRGFKTLYTDAYAKAPVYYDKIAMTVPSGTRSEAYGWLGQFPQLREWLDGEREVKNLTAHGFTIENRKFESTVGVSRDDISDDRLGALSPLFSEMGQRARQHPDELVFAMLAQGFTSQCYDGQYYFDTDHPAKDKNGNQTIVSNVDDGTANNGTPGAPWFLMDTTRSIRPIIWQEREKYDFKSVTAPNDHNVFMTDKYKYGVRARVNCGFGLWQLAYASKAPLTPDNYAKARAAMMKIRGNEGRIMGIRPSTLIVNPDQEEAARNIVTAVTGANGASNPWSGTAELIVTPYLGG